MIVLVVSWVLASCLESQRWANAGAVDGFVTSCCPTRALLHAHGMVRAPDEKLAVADLLEVAFKTQVCVPNGEQLGVHRAMRRMASGATFAQGIVFEHIRPALLDVAAKAIVICRKQGGAAADLNRALVRRMALSAREPAFWNRMMTGQIKLSADVHMALEAYGFSRARGVNGEPSAETVGYGTAGSKAVRRLGLATGIRVKAARTMAGFTAGIERVGPFGHQASMVRGREITVNLFMALLAFLGADIFRARDIGQQNN